LSRGLEKEPLLQVIFLGESVQRQLLLLVVGVDQVLDNGASLPDRDISVGINDCGNAAIGVQLLVGWLLEIGYVHEDFLIRKLQLLQDDGDFPGVGTRCVRVEGNGLDGRHVDILDKDEWRWKYI
jgi:hypothetical protein